MASFILVHGAWQGAWAWAPVIPLLEAAGHTAIPVDLPGNGADGTPPEAVTTMVYGEHIARLIDCLDEGADGPVILVGHSMGGTAVAQACELRPGRVALAIYLCAFLLPDGESVADFYARAWQDWMTGAHARVTYSADGMLSSIDPAAAVEVFHHMADPEAARAAAAKLTPQPEGGRRTRLRLSPEGFGAVRRVYIETLQDRSVFHELQRRMYTETPCERVITLDTDHAPQLSATRDLAGILMGLAQELAA